jgi:hypothetical protein
MPYRPIVFGVEWLEELLYMCEIKGLRLKPPLMRIFT